MKYLQRLLTPTLWMRQKRLARARPQLDRNEFVDRVAQQGGDRQAAVFIWDFLQEWCDADGFTPYPDDPLYRVYGIAEEELEIDLICGVFEHLNLPLPNQQDVDSFVADFQNVDNPLRVAQFVSRMRATAAAQSTRTR